MARIHTWAAIGCALTTAAAYAQGTTVRKPAPAPTAAVAAAKPDDEALASRAAVRLSNVSRRVLALYYPWYGTPQRSGRWLHQENVDAEKKSIDSHARYPALGAYDSTDPVVLEKHLDQAKAAGIDTLVCSWWGRQDPTDKAVRALLPLAAAKGVTLSVMWERLPGLRDAEAATSDLTYLAETFGKHPGYLKEGGQPVFFALAPVCQALPVERWAEVLAGVAKAVAPGARIIGEGASQGDVLLWDGLHSLAYLPQMKERSPTVCARVQSDLYRVPILLGRAAGRISVVTLSPGCDDRKLTKKQGPKAALVIEREDGLLYRALWEQAAASGPDWVLINSFNQWH
ncbi:MAG: hypothetical protein ACO1SX_02690, partial [Actinomycetota bacterium]